jgi:hypothetical protein
MAKKKRWTVKEEPDGWYVITPRGFRESGPWPSEDLAWDHIPVKAQLSKGRPRRKSQKDRLVHKSFAVRGHKDWTIEQTLEGWWVL